MAGFHRPLRAVSHAPHAGLAVKGPVRAILSTRMFHQDCTVRAGSGAQSAAYATVVGEHQFPHEKPTNQQVDYGKQGDKPEEQQAPADFP